ncbi:MAG: metallophosphoesterase family protein [Anaerolineae bacterium]|nr:metallophosphoesterase family protein [Anaerolineae bacterium]
MTRLAIIADIHGNMPALEAVLADLDTLAPDAVIVDGDLVGRGPQSREVLETIGATDWPVVAGNHEEFWLQCAHGDTPTDWQDGWWTPTRAQLDGLQNGWIDWMAALPQEHVIDVPGLPPIQIVHGSPRRSNEGLHPFESEAKMLDALSTTPYRIVVGAHTHFPMNERVGPYWVLNTGSVGAPFNHDPAAQYLVLTAHDHTWQVELRRVSYDLTAALRIWHETGYWESGVAARIFAYELKTARFHFWHYVRYCNAHDLGLNDDASFATYVRVADTIPEW